jgi:hypothetical protein
MPLRGGGEIGFDAGGPRKRDESGEIRGMTTRRTKVSCDDCFFRRHGLCALAESEPCATFRPDTPEGLSPPRQMRFVFRQERRTRAAWAFPSAQEQLSLHA